MNQHVTPYASLLPDGDDLETYTRILVERAVKAKQLGFRAAKLEICIKGPYSHNSLQIADDRECAKIVAACRKAVGPEMTLMVDVAYAWADWKEALRAIDMFADQDIYFIETPLPSDDIEGYAKLVKTSPVRVAAGEWLNSRFEFRELMDRDALDVVQPDVGRVGGLTEARRVTMEFYIVTSVITILSAVFSYVFMIGGGRGGPGTSTMIVELYIFNALIRTSLPGVASAVSVMLFVVSILLIIPLFAARRRANEIETA